MNDAHRNFTHPDWSSRTVFLLGGGPSLRNFDTRRLEGYTVAAINEAGLSLYPKADLLFWSDVRWVDWNMDRLHVHTGPYRYTCQPHRVREIPRARLVTHKAKEGGKWRPFVHDPKAVAGHDSGTKAINLLYHTRASRVVLLGFDMRDLPMDRWEEGSFHDKHKLPPLEGQRAKFRDVHDLMASALPDGFEVVNATPGSALTCYPMVELEDVL